LAQAILAQANWLAKPLLCECSLGRELPPSVRSSWTVSGSVVLGTEPPQRRDCCATRIRLTMRVQSLSRLSRFCMGLGWFVLGAEAAQLRAVDTSVGKLAEAHGFAGEASFFAYDYSRHGQDWYMGMCASRSRQSPVDFTSSMIAAADLNAGLAPPLHFGYRNVTTPFELKNNGKTYSASFAALGYGGVTHEDAWYDLMNVNVHAVSEHTWASAHQPLELHLVHKRYDGDALLIVAVPVESPSQPLGGRVALTQETTKASLRSLRQSPASRSDVNFSSAVQSFLGAALPQPHESVRMPAGEENPLNLNALVEGGLYFEYAGSMTAPPCAEIATWLVRTSPIMASDLQVKLFTDGIFATTNGQGNYREVMPFNARTVGLKRAVYEEAPLPDLSAIAPSPAGAPEIPTTLSPTEWRAMELAKAAMNLAENATEYAEHLNKRLEDCGKGAQGVRTTTEAPKLVLKRAADEAMANASRDITEAVQKGAQTAADHALGAVKSALRSMQALNVTLESYSPR